MPAAKNTSPYAWYVAIVLCLGQLVAIMDRFLVGVVAEPIKRSLTLTDSQVGILVGPIFLTLYIITTLPFGRAADVFNRKIIITVGIFLWSIATIFSGFAKGFTDLLWARVFVGLGEASLFPAAMSLIAAYFPPETRYRGISIFSSGQSMGRAAAFIGGGALLAYFATANPLNTLLHLNLSAWQLLFVVAGFFGLLICALILTIREPKREAGNATGDLRGALAWFWEKRGPYLTLMVAYALGALVAYVFALWSVSYCVRRFHAPIGTVSALMGVFSLILGPIGNLASGALSDRLNSRGIRFSYLWILLWILVPSPVIAFFFWKAPSFPVAMFFYGLQYLVIAGIGPQGFGGLHAITPARFLGVQSALFVMFYTVVAAGVGPLVVGMISDRLSAGGSMLGMTIFLVTAVSSAVGVVATVAGLLIGRVRKAGAAAT